MINLPMVAGNRSGRKLFTLLEARYGEGSLVSGDAESAREGQVEVKKSHMGIPGGKRGFPLVSGPAEANFY